jgi:predicted TIM-barrel fold metal-dependent hydrolase
MTGHPASHEPILEPELPIVDPHHHLWVRPAGALPPPPHHPFVAAIANVNRYLLDELIADMTSGHNVRATVFLECHQMYRAYSATIRVRTARQSG